MRIVFFGTPDFAVPSLRALIGEGFDVVGVVTQPDKPRGRSRSTLVPPPIKTVAEGDGIPLLQPDKPSPPGFARELARFEADLGVVVAYGHILKGELLLVPRLGMVNVHASLLPRLRGAAPIQWAILEGLESTGVTVMQMDEGMDTGPILHQVPTPVPHDETGGELAARLSELGALALVECLTLMSQDAVDPRPQDHSRATYAPKIDRQLCRLTWTSDAMAIARQIRAFDPKPGAWSELDGAPVKLFGASYNAERGKAGEILSVEPELVVAAGLGAVRVQEIQPEGRPRMPAPDWARGRGAAVGQMFT